MGTVKEWLEDVAKTNKSSEADSKKMQSLLHKVGFDKAVVVYGIVYPEGRGRPVSIHAMAKEILSTIPAKKKGEWASSFPDSVKYNRFGRGGCYTCACCGKRARETGITAGSGYCAACVNRMQLENEHHDHGHETKVKGCPECENKKSKGAWAKRRDDKEGWRSYEDAEKHGYIVLMEQPHSYRVTPKGKKRLKMDKTNAKRRVERYEKGRIKNLSKASRVK